MAWLASAICGAVVQFLIPDERSYGIFGFGEVSPSSQQGAFNKTELINGDGDMFGRKKKEIPPLQARYRNSIVQDALTLIAVANEAERESFRSGNAESTDARELCRTEGVLKAQTTLTERIVLSQSSELTMREIATELIQPVVDRSVVGDVAQLALDYALHRAGKRFAAG